TPSARPALRSFLEFPFGVPGQRHPDQLTSRCRCQTPCLGPPSKACERTAAKPTPRQPGIRSPYPVAAVGQVFESWRETYRESGPKKAETMNGRAPRLAASDWTANESQDRHSGTRVRAPRSSCSWLVLVRRTTISLPNRIREPRQI